METGLAGRTALVTGSAGGIGRACAFALATEGAKVVLADVDAQAAEQASRRGRGRCLVRGGRDRCGRRAEAGHEDRGGLRLARRPCHLRRGLPCHAVRRDQRRGVGSDPGGQPPRNLSDLSGGGEGDDSERARADRDDRVARRAGRRSRRRGVLRRLQGGSRGAHEVGRPLCRPSWDHRELRQPRRHRDADDRGLAAGRPRADGELPRRSAGPAHPRRSPGSCSGLHRTRPPSSTAPTWT